MVGRPPDWILLAATLHLPMLSDGSRSSGSVTKREISYGQRLLCESRRARVTMFLENVLRGPENALILIKTPCPRIHFHPFMTCSAARPPPGKLYAFPVGVTARCSSMSDVSGELTKLGCLELLIEYRASREVR